MLKTGSKKAVGGTEGGGIREVESLLGDLDPSQGLAMCAREEMAWV